MNKCISECLVNKCGSWLTLSCRDVSKISLWSVEYILNQSTSTFGVISNSIEISLGGLAPGMGVSKALFDRFDHFAVKIGYELLRKTKFHIFKTVSTLGRRHNS